MATTPKAPAGPLINVESEVIGLFVQIARGVGLPRSVGEIYGLLFITAQPMAMDDLMERLCLSKGSASQGLKFLRNAGAVRIVYAPSDRRLHYEAVAELSGLVTRFLRDQIVPNWDTSLSRVERITGMMKSLPAEERSRIGDRVAVLQSWQKNTRRFFPMVLKLLGG